MALKVISAKRCLEALDFCSIDLAPETVVGFGGQNELDATSIDILGDGFKRVRDLASTVHSLANLRSVVGVKLLVARCVDRCFKDFVEASKWSSMRLPVCLPSDGTLEDAVSAVIDVDLVGECAAGLDQVAMYYAAAEKGQLSTMSCCGSLNQLLHSLLNEFGDSGLQNADEITSFLKSTPPPSKLAVLTLCSVVSEMHEVMMAFVYLWVTFIKNMKYAVSESAILRAEVVRLCLDLQMRTKALGETFDCETVKEHCSIACVWSVDEAKSWLQALSDTFEKMKSSLVDRVVSEISSMSDNLQKATPKISHLINESSWIKGQCKKYLLQGADRAGLANGSIALHKALQNIAKDYSKLGCGCGRIDRDYDAIQAAQGVFDGARHVVQTIAHLHVLQVMTGQQQLQEAVELHAKDLAVAKPLKEALASLATKSLAQGQSPDQPSKKRKTN